MALFKETLTAVYGWPWNTAQQELDDARAAFWHAPRAEACSGFAKREACDRAPEPGRRRCRLHGGAPNTGAPQGNRNARRHGRYSAQSREIQALGRILNRVADLARAQLAVLESLAQEDVRRVQAAEERVAQCMRRLVATALTLDRVLADCGDHEGRRRFVEGALRLTENV